MTFVFPYLIIMWTLFRVLLRPLEKRSDWPRRSSRTVPCPTGLGTRRITKLDITQRGETGGEQSSSSEQRVSSLHLALLLYSLFPHNTFAVLQREYWLANFIIKIILNFIYLFFAYSFCQLYQHKLKYTTNSLINVILLFYMDISLNHACILNMMISLAKINT
jgi:hypothetical protein